MLADGLVGAGDEVTLLAPEGSQTRAHLVSSLLDDQPDLYGLVEHLMGAALVIRGADVVHDHTDIRALITAVNGRGPRTPTRSRWSASSATSWPTP